MGEGAASASVAATLERARQQACDMGFDSAEVYEPWLPVDVCQQILTALDGATGGGAAAIMAAAVMLRAITLPWHLRSLQKQCDRVALLPVYMGFMKAIENARRRRGGGQGGGAREAEQAEAELVKLTAQWNDFTQTTKFSPLQGMGYQLMCMMPLHILAYFSLRGIMGHPDAFRNIVVAPTLWLDSLVFPDPLAVLPVLSACAMLLNAEINAPPPQDGQEETAEYFKLVVRGAVLTFVPLTSLLPAALVLFMGTNAVYTGIAIWVYRKFCWVPPVVEARWSPTSSLPHSALAATAMQSPLVGSSAPPTPPPPPLRDAAEPGSPL